MNIALKKKIIKYIENNQPSISWDYTDILSKQQTIQILESEQGLFEFKDKLYEMNLENIFQIEQDFFCQIKEKFSLSQGIEEFQDHIHIDLNINDIIKNSEPIIALIIIHSNYDCANSMSNMQPHNYLHDVFQRVKIGVKKKDYLWEAGQIYGASLLCFVFKTDIMSLRNLKANFKKSITIPAKTQFGLFSSFVGGGSPFENETFKTITLPKEDKTKYDCIDIMADIEQHYTMQEVYGDMDWVKSQNIKVT